MKQIAILEYEFQFEPGGDTWQRGFDFERDLIDFFAANRLDAELAEVTGGSGKRVFIISKMDQPESMAPVPVPQVQKGIQRALKDVGKV